MRPLVTMRQALEDSTLLGHVLAGESWAAWRALLIAMMGESLTDEERRHFTALTGREREPLEPVEEFWGVIGRRGGKSRAMAVLGAYVGGLCDHSQVLALGERGKLPVLAASQRQATIVFGYILAIFQATPALAELIDGEPTADTLTLSNGVDIEVKAANFRTVRSITAVAAIGDEAAFWHVEGSANPDSEILGALRPALATTAGPLIVISSPYARKGEVYGTWKRHFGPMGDPLILVAHGASRDLNPSLPQSVVDRALERDQAAAMAEYMAQFRSDVETLLSLEAIEAATVGGRLELPRQMGKSYFGFTDPAGGSGADSFTLAIAHKEGDTAILDLVREVRPPFSPEAVIAEFSEALKVYGVATVTGDRWGGDFPRERFRVHGINYATADRTASDYFRDLLPAINGGQVELLDHARLTAQLAALERRISRTGKDLISHPPGGHDDIANSVAGALVLASVEEPVDLAQQADGMTRLWRALNSRGGVW